MMKVLVNPFFIFAFILYLGTLIAKFSAYELPFFIQNYLADFLALPIILSFTLALLRARKKHKNLLLDTYKIIAAWLYISLFFEFILPALSFQYTQDYCDVIAYLFGAIVYYLYQKLYLLNETKKVD